MPDLKKLPLIVSYPRCGRHWVVACTEYYFRRPCAVRINNFLSNKERKQPVLFWHHHDETVCNATLADRILYLYRDPVDTLYSLFRVLPRDGSPDRWVDTRTDQYRRHLLKYLPTAEDTIRYDRMQNDFVSEFTKVCEFLEGPVDEDCIRATDAFVTPEKMVGQTQWLPENPKDYYALRDTFRHLYGDEIDEKITNSPELKEYFKP